MKNVSAKKIALASLVSGVVLISLGHLFSYQLFADFFARNLGSAINVYRDDPVGWAVMLAQFSIGTLIAAACAYTSAEVPVKDGLKTGALIGLIVGVGFGFELYGATNVANLQATILDTALWVVRGACAGGLAGWLLGRD